MILAENTAEALPPDAVSVNNTLLIVDDEPAVIRSITRSLRRENINVLAATSGPGALEILKDQSVGVVISDQRMPGMDGVSLLSAVRQYDPDIVRLLLTGHASIEGAIDAINRSQIFEYLTKPWEQTELLGTLRRAFEHHHLLKENQRLQVVTQDQNLQLKQHNNTLEQRVASRTQQLFAAVREGILMLSMAAEARDDNTGGHIQRIRTMTTCTCRKMGMSGNESELIGFFSMMHDVGKIHIPDKILNKPGKLTEDEWRIMQSHTTVGEKILGNSRYYAEARRIARSHHERFDGSGYPDGLKGKEIPLSARIVAVVDVFDALTSGRPYKAAWSVSEALKEIKRIAGTHLDADIVDVFANAIAELMPDGME